MEFTILTIELEFTIFNNIIVTIMIVLKSGLEKLPYAIETNN